MKILLTTAFFCAVFIGIAAYVSTPDYITKREFKAAHVILNNKLDSALVTIELLRADVSILKTYAAAQSLQNDTLRAGQVAIYNEVKQPNALSLLDKIKIIMR